MEDFRNLDDAKLIEAIYGDPELYRELVKRYESKLLRYAVSMIKNPDEAADAVQEAFISAFVNLKGFDTKKKFSSWIYRIVHNQVITQIRKKKEVMLDETHEDLLRDDTDLERLLEAKETKELLSQKITELPHKYRSCLILHLEDHTYNEISEILRIPIGTVGTNINRGKKLIKEKLMAENIYAR